MKAKIIIIGGGGHAKVIINTLKKINKYDIMGYVSDENTGKILGINYIGNDDCLTELYNNKIKTAALGIGQVMLSSKRLDVVISLKKIGFYLPSLVSPDAIINSDVYIGEGTQILDGVIINSGTQIGNFSIINTNATIEHDCIVGDYCHIATRATLSGGVEVGDFSMIGSNAVIVQYKKISANTLIGSGGVVIKDIIEPGIYVGNPARKIK